MGNSCQQQIYKNMYFWAIIRSTVFWDNVKTILKQQGRLLHGWKKDLANTINMPLTTMMNQLHRRTEPKVSDAIKIADYLGISLEILLNNKTSFSRMRSNEELKQSLTEIINQQLDVAKKLKTLTKKGNLELSNKMHIAQDNEAPPAAAEEHEVGEVALAYAGERQRERHVLEVSPEKMELIMLIVEGLERLDEAQVELFEQWVNSSVPLSRQRPRKHYTPVEEYVFSRNEGVIYRMAVKGDTWHFCTDCDFWPTSDYKSSKTIPEGPFCGQCMVKAHQGRGILNYE